MLEPSEADLPLLFLVLVVLPTVTYILLGKWSEAAKKKARLSTLAQLSAEEDFTVEPVSRVPLSSPDILPVAPFPKVGSYECAKCFAPATTRCSKCKSVRYCSGKCQIIHWRQGHKQECRDSIQSPCPSRKSVPLRASGFMSDYSSDTSFTTADTSHNSSLRKFPDSQHRVTNKWKMGGSRTDDSSASAFEDAADYATDTPTKHESTMYTRLPSKEIPSGRKLGTGNFTSSAEIHKRGDTSTSNYGSKLRHAKHQSDELISEMRLRPSCSSEYRVNNNENGLKFASEGGYSTVSETVDLNSSAEDHSVKDNIMFKKPPYTLDPTLQNSNGISNNGVMKIISSKKSTKVHKSSLPGVTSRDMNKMLFPYEDLVKFFQCEIWGITPRGILNCGNSCYANAVLQCLTCTKPLMVYLLRRSHSKTCRTKDWCLMCELEHHVQMLREGGGALSPTRILSNMRNIGCRMGGGNQEDAHEFLRLLVMSMQSICLEAVGGEKEVGLGLQETTLIQQIFGGRLKSKVKCLRCHLESERYEHIMDLTLEIHGWVESLEDALTQFTAPEDLDGENMYKCGRCSAYVKARKQLSVNEVPNILTIVLKRFQTGKYGKINKCVTFPEMLDMIPFVTGTADSPPLYMLYGVVVHLGNSNASFSGHYISYVKDAQGTWFKIDDAEVQAVSLNEVMSEGAYMLFYSRSFPRPPSTCINKSSPQPASKKISRNIPPPRVELFSDFSDATSSDWSVFTSSDESSFTTESTRDSFSTVDHGEVPGLDPISSIFAPPFYIPEYANNSISCTKFSPLRPHTRFFSEKKGLVMDSNLPARPPRNVHIGTEV